jgi:hypothetical protein
MTYSFIKKQRMKGIDLISGIKINISSSCLSDHNFQYKAELHLAKKSVKKGQATMSLACLTAAKLQPANEQNTKENK